MVIGRVLGGGSGLSGAGRRLARGGPNRNPTLSEKLVCFDMQFIGSYLWLHRGPPPRFLSAGQFWGESPGI